ncbi:hypothetical protein CNMCM6936_007635 [Aspergillus lentulus]|nr:hypothetical protein CNMCM6936_007635 [Aspergillus lentulus]
MATQMASVTTSDSATSRQPAAASGSSGRNPDRNNGDRRGPGEGKVKKAKKVALAKIHLIILKLTVYRTEGPVVLCRRWGHDAAKCRVGARALAAVAAAFQDLGHPPPLPLPVLVAGRIVLAWTAQIAGSVVGNGASCSACSSKGRRVSSGKYKARKMNGTNGEARVFLRRWISVLMSLSALKKCPHFLIDGTE